jgi:hypothetical protein
MDMASVKMRIKPVVIIVLLLALVAAIPDKRPTVEARLSSTPKVKFRSREALAGVCRFTGLSVPEK